MTCYCVRTIVWHIIMSQLWHHNPKILIGGLQIYVIWGQLTAVMLELWHSNMSHWSHHELSRECSLKFRQNILQICISNKIARHIFHPLDTKGKNMEILFKVRENQFFEFLWIVAFFKCSMTIKKKFHTKML